MKAAKPMGLLSCGHGGQVLSFIGVFRDDGLSAGFPADK